MEYLQDILQDICIHDDDSFNSIVERISSLSLSLTDDRERLSAADSFLSSLLNQFENDCVIFDNAQDINLFDVKYSTIKVATESVCKQLLLSLTLLNSVEHVDPNNHNKNIVIKVLGRFTLLHIGDENLRIQSDSVHSKLFQSIAVEAINYLLSRVWSFDEAVYIRITSFNLLCIIGITDIDTFNDFCRRIHIRKNSKKLEETTYCIRESLDWYCQSFISNSINAEPIQIQWFYCYIYKKRFGLIHCKQFKRATTPPYSFTAIAQSPCFKNMSPRNAGLTNKVISVKTGVQKRSGEYVPSESSFLYNFSTMMFE